jgi:hypothetical protein
MGQNLYIYADFNFLYRLLKTIPKRLICQDFL